MNPADERSDAELIALCNSGDEGAFAVLFERHKGFVHRVAARFARDADAAHDAVQETFLYLLRQFPGFTLTSRLTTYLYPIAKNAALARTRKDMRMRLGLARAEETAESAAGMPIDEKGLPPAVQRTLAAMPEGQREALVLRVVEGMSMEEIGLALGIPAGTVKSRLHAAMAALRGASEEKKT